MAFYLPIKFNRTKINKKITVVAMVIMKIFLLLHTPKGNGPIKPKNPHSVFALDFVAVRILPIMTSKKPIKTMIIPIKISCSKPSPLF
jgi:hypothetical protein